MSPRAPRTIDDINDVEALIRYAIASQISRLKPEAKVTVTNVALSKAIGKDKITPKVAEQDAGQDEEAEGEDDGTNGTKRNAATNFTHCLNDKGPGGQKFTARDIKILDSIFHTLGLPGAGNLSALTIRLRGDRPDWTNLAAYIPPGWSRLLDADSNREIDVLMSAADLITKYWAADLVQKPVAREHEERIPKVIERLALLGAAPPTVLNIEALVLAGTWPASPSPTWRSSWTRAWRRCRWASASGAC